MVKLEKINRWDILEKKNIYVEYEEYFKEVKKNWLNMWSYGDVEFDEEDMLCRLMGCC